MRIPILTYHGVQVNGSEYASNDHIGLAEDLELVHGLGWRVVQLDAVIRALVTGAGSKLPMRALGLTFDDGSLFDWLDLPHPAHGMQRSMVNILRDFRDRHGTGAQPGLQATSFVIASPDARAELDRECLIGRGWMGDEWWREAHAEGLLRIANHSWDHRHSAVPEPLRYGGRYGDFHALADMSECDWQVRQAQDYLRRVLGMEPEPCFAYPYGHVPELLAEEYFPRTGEQIGLHAAFTTEPEPVTEASNRWRLPRYVFRRDWQSPDGLRKLLDAV